jgi:hypothetical protein
MRCCEVGFFGDVIIEVVELDNSLLASGSIQNTAATESDLLVV